MNYTQKPWMNLYIKKKTELGGKTETPLDKLLLEILKITFTAEPWRISEKKVEWNI